MLRILMTLSALLLVASGCTVASPPPVEIDGFRLHVNSTSITQRLNFSKREHRVHGSVSIAREIEHDEEEFFGPPTVRITSILDSRGNELLGEADGTRTDVKISNAVQRAQWPGQANSTIGFSMDHSISRLRAVRGVLEVPRVLKSEIVDVSLSDLTEPFDVADRCRLWAKRDERADHSIQLDLTIQLTVDERSVQHPNAPMRIEILADDGGVLGEPRLVSSRGRVSGITQHFRFSPNPTITEKVAAVRLHLVTVVEWTEHAFEFTNIPLRGHLR